MDRSPSRAVKARRGFAVEPKQAAAHGIQRRSRHFENRNFSGFHVLTSCPKDKPMPGRVAAPTRAQMLFQNQICVNRLLLIDRLVRIPCMMTSIRIAKSRLDPRFCGENACPFVSPRAAVVAIALLSVAALGQVRPRTV